MSQIITLHLLNGPMRGRLLRLPRGIFTFGLGDVDLVTPLEGGITKVSLQVIDSDVILLDHVSCWVDGFLSSPGVLPLNKVIDLAGQAFVLLPEGTELSKVTIPERIGAGKWQLSRQQKQGIGIASLLFVIAIIIAGWYWYQRTETVGDAMGRLGVQGWLIQQVRQPVFKDLKFVWQMNGTLTVTGVCHDEQALIGLMQMIRSQGVFYRLDTVCQDRLLDNVRYLLDQFGYQEAEVLSGSDVGDVQIIGNIQADSNWQNVTRRLNELGGLKSWAVSGRGENNAAELLDAIRNAGLMGKVSLERQGKHLIVSGQLNEQQQQRLAKVLDGWLGDRSLTLIWQNMTPMVTNDTVFISPVVSVGGNKEKPYLVLADGQRIEPGAIVNNGYQIVNIDAQLGVTLFYNEQLIQLPLVF